MKKAKTGKDMLKLFDEHADMFYMFGSRTKDFTPIIDTLELFVKQMKITREVSQEIKKELSDTMRDSELRLFYVAISRAKDFLTITYSEFNGWKEMYPSEFLDIIE